MTSNNRKSYSFSGIILTMCRWVNCWIGALVHVITKKVIILLPCKQIGSDLEVNEPASIRESLAESWSKFASCAIALHLEHCAGKTMCCLDVNCGTMRHTN